MNESLKTLEGLAFFLQSEIRRLEALPCTAETYDLLRKAKLLAVDLQTTLQDARAWNS